MNFRQSSPYILVLAVFISLLLLYTAYDKVTKTLVPEKLVKVVTFQDIAYSLREFNKVFALAAIGLISAVFLLGPLTKLWPKVFARFLYLRKPVGLVGFGIAAIHSVYSFIVIYEMSIGKMFIDNPKYIGAVTAVLSLFIFFLMSITSTKEAVAKMGYRRWKALQTFGYAGLLLALAHFFILETKPDIGLDVRPFGLLFFWLPIAALALRTIIIFIKVPERKSYEEHIGEKPPA